MHAARVFFPRTRSFCTVYTSSNEHVGVLDGSSIRDCDIIKRARRYIGRLKRT